MPWIADLHIHSHFSMATSKESNPQNLHRWAGLKGVTLVGTGDFTHPGWRAELRDTLTSAEPGFFRLKAQPVQEIPDQSDVRFVVTGELSTIYKKNGRVRKVHHLIVLPSLEDADQISTKLEELGMNIRSDGRPILGIDSYRLLELTLNICPEVIFIPAHIWTPHFSVFGSNSGFDDIQECYEDLTQNIFALETGLSSDPGMNWRWSALDRFTLVSNSDAHNPQNLAREANLFHSEFSYQGMKQALQNKKLGQFGGTIEFFPEEGKYHLDGHRNCNISLLPEDTIAKAGICPVCGRKVTVGVLHRVAELADRPPAFQLENAAPYYSMVPLREIISSAIGAGVASQKVNQLYVDLIKNLGPELAVLRETDLGDIVKVGGTLIAEGIRRLRAGEVSIQPGYDGVYGVISVLREDDRQALRGQAALFESRIENSAKRGLLLETTVNELANDLKNYHDRKTQRTPNEFNQEQLEIIDSKDPVTIVIAGPGTGKTRTLVERMAHLIKNCNVEPTEITGVTFTNKAAAEMKSRLMMILNGDKRANKINIGTFHSLAWRILNQNPIPFTLKLLDQYEVREIVEEVLRQNRIPMTAREAALVISLIKNKYLWEPELAIPSKMMELYQAYQKSLQIYQRIDFDDILIKIFELWEENPGWLQPLKKQFQHLLVDEFQDLNLLQYHLMRRWGDGNRSLMVIGDPNQSIYGFRGGSVQFFESIRQDFLQSVSRQLHLNYRTPNTILKIANLFIQECFRQTATAVSGDETSQKVVWIEAFNERIAAKAVVNEIVGLLGGATMLSAHGQSIGKRRAKISDGSFSFNDFAILYRTGKQAAIMEQMLTAEGFPYRVVGTTETLESSTVKEFLTFFRYLHHPEDLFLLRANLRQPRWGFKNTEISDIIQSLTNCLPGSRGDNLDCLLELEIDPEILTRLRQFYGVVQYYKAQINKKSNEIIADWILRMAPVEVDDLEHLKKICENYRNLEELVQFLPLATEADIFRKGNRTTGTETITLSTIHASKGLEFPIVFMIGVEEGLIPYGPDPDPDTVAEELRLFYVGLTRTKKELYLVNSKYRTRYGETVPVEESRFLKQIPKELIEKIEAGERERQAKQLELFT